MSLLSELQAIEPGYNGMNVYTVEDEGPEDVETVYDEFVESRRWYESWFAVFKRGDELVGLHYQVPSTEMQEGGDFEHEWCLVEPYEVTETKYREVK